ncbi:MAG: hypothetical protein ACUVT5_02710 [Candidatus Bathyarchaeales archaeon]
MNHPISIERSNIILDGNKYSLERRLILSADQGIFFENQNNMIIQNLTVKGFSVGSESRRGTNATQCH